MTFAGREERLLGWISAVKFMIPFGFGGRAETAVVKDVRPYHTPVRQRRIVVEAPWDCPRDPDDAEVGPDDVVEPRRLGRR